MKAMYKKSLDSYKKGVITIEIQSLIPERFINLLWNRGVFVKNLRKVNITTMILDAELKDYHKIEEAAKRTDTKIKIINRQGMSFLFLKLKRNVTLIVGAIVFIVLLYYMSTFLWGIEITSDKYLSPYEIRRELISLGIKPGIKKNNVNVYELEDKMMKTNENVMWVKARIEGSKIKIDVAERQNPPQTDYDKSICNVVAKMDGEIVRIYSTSGTPIVKPGDIVKKGDILIKGEQGKEGGTYPVHAEGDIIAKTFYEDAKEIKLKGNKKVKTGSSEEDIYLELFGKKIYLKKVKDKFSDYDKIEESGKVIKKVIYYELKDDYFEINEEDAIENAINSSLKDMERNLSKDAKILDKIVNKDYSEDSIKLNIVFVIEQNISEKQPLESSHS